MADKNRTIRLEDKKPRDPNRDVLRTRKPGRMKDRREVRGGAKNLQREYRYEE